MNYTFLKEKDDTIYFKGYRMEIFLPKYYIKDGFAIFKGKRISTIGIFNFKVYIDEDVKERSAEKHSLNLPMTIEFEFTDSYDTIIENENYHVFILEDDSIFIDNIYMEQTSENTKNFVMKFHSGHLSPDIKYSNILSLYLNSMELNKCDLGNPSVMYEIIISELCRSKTNDKIPFRKYLNRHQDAKDTDYVSTNIVKLPSINSTFAGIISQNITENVLNGISKTKNGEVEDESDLEKVIKY